MGKTDLLKCVSFKLWTLRFTKGISVCFKHIIYVLCGIAISSEGSALSLYKEKKLFLYLKNIIITKKSNNCIKLLLMLFKRMLMYSHHTSRLFCCSSLAIGLMEQIKFKINEQIEFNKINQFFAINKLKPIQELITNKSWQLFCCSYFNNSKSV